MKILLLALTLFISSLSNASTTDCKDLHVGRIWINKGQGLYAVVYLNNRGDSSGSYWSHFTGWTPEEKNTALATLMMAKASNHRVNVVTESESACDLLVGGTVTKAIYLTTNP